MLDDIRILEVSAPHTMLAGRILADLGAEVVVVEPPAGAAGRRLEPFIDEMPGIERSLTWHALNRNKRGITLDLTSIDGRELFADLLLKFDVVLYAGEGREALEQIAIPGSVVKCAVSAFAAAGPKSTYAASDLIVMAASGVPGVTGESDRPPLFFSVPQSLMEAGAEAAIAILAGLAARDRDGHGQRVEVSARIAAMMGSMSQALALASGNAEVGRSSGAISIAGVKVPGIYQSADGFVLITIGFGPVFGQMTQKLAAWVADEGHLAREVAEVNWATFIADLSARKASPAALQALVDGLTSLARAITSAQLAQAARKLGLLASPVMNMKDVAESEQFRARGLFSPVAVGERTIDAPVRLAQFSNFAIETRHPAPALSQHTVEILRSELGLSPTEIQALFVHGII